MVLADLTIGRSRPHSMLSGGELKSTSVPDFRRTRRSLQFGGVKWTSPRHFTDSLYSLHLVVRRTSWDREKWRMIQYATEIKWGGSDAVRIFELANKAHFLYVSQPVPEKAKLLRMVLSNCAVDAVSIYPSYKKPFDLIFARAKNEEWRAQGTISELFPAHS